MQNYCDNIEVVGQAGGVTQGLLLIRKVKPDVVFLDIQMPDGTGFDLLEKIAVINFQVIFITAYDQYALKAIKFSALDYILKPVDPNQLMEAVKKIKTPDNNFSDITKKINPAN